MSSVDRVTKTYGTFTAVDDVTFTARPGRITGFLGPNGAGKSTTLRVLVGLTPPDHGTAHVLGRRFLLVGFVLGTLIRNSPTAIVAYMVYAFVAPGLLALLAFQQDWFADARPWLDAKYNQDALLRGDLAGDGWSHLTVSARR